MVFGSIDISSSIDEGGSRVQSYMDVSCAYQLFEIMLAFNVLFSRCT
jgi:hypothetical protein